MSDAERGLMLIALMNEAEALKTRIRTLADTSRGQMAYVLRASSLAEELRLSLYRWMKAEDKAVEARRIEARRLGEKYGATCSACNGSGKAMSGDNCVVCGGTGAV